MKTDLLTIPNVGKNTKQDLLDIGITCVEDLKGKIQRNCMSKIVSENAIKKTVASYMCFAWRYIMQNTLVGTKRN